MYLYINLTQQNMYLTGSWGSYSLKVRRRKRRRRRNTKINQDIPQVKKINRNHQRENLDRILTVLQVKIQVCQFAFQQYSF